MSEAICSHDESTQQHLTTDLTVLFAVHCSIEEAAGEAELSLLQRQRRLL